MHIFVLRATGWEALLFTLYNEEDFCVFTCTCVNGRVIVRKVEWFWSKWIVTRVAKAKGYVNVTAR